MSIQVNYYPSEYEITVQTGWWNDGYFEMETCNHAGMEQEKDYTFDGEYNGVYYKCDKCDETFDQWEIESDDTDYLYQAWKDSNIF